MLQDLRTVRGANLPWLRACTITYGVVATGLYMTWRPKPPFRCGGENTSTRQQAEKYWSRHAICNIESWIYKGLVVRYQYCGRQRLLFLVPKNSLNASYGLLSSFANMTLSRSVIPFLVTKKLRVPRIVCPKLGSKNLMCRSATSS